MPTNSTSIGEYLGGAEVKALTELLTVHLEGHTQPLGDALRGRLHGKELLLSS